MMGDHIIIEIKKKNLQVQSVDRMKEDEGENKKR